MRILFTILFCLLTMTASANEIRGIFFQPQQSDLAVPLENWPKIFALAKSKNFDTLVVQWTSFGDVFSSSQNQAWLKDRMLEASDAKLKLIIGLTSEPEIFTRLKQPPKLVGSYLRKLNELNIKLANTWVQSLPSDVILGWYLPLEVDDRQWREVPARIELTKYLVRQVAELKQVVQIPVYISSFFTGSMTPERYAAMLENIEAQSQIHFWVQNGSGTDKLMGEERDLYLSAVSKCAGYAVSGYIFELFKQTQADHEFAAISLSPLEMAKALQQKTPCNGGNLFFALNYLINFKSPELLAVSQY